MKNITFRRHGDLNFHEISKEEYNATKGEVIKHNGSFVLQEGETTGHRHVITVPDITNMEIKKLPDGSWALHAKGATLTHEDHKTVEIAPVYYRQNREREVDHFNLSVERKVID